MPKHLPAKAEVCTSKVRLASNQTPRFFTLALGRGIGPTVCRRIVGEGQDVTHRLQWVAVVVAILLGIECLGMGRNSHQ